MSRRFLLMMVMVGALSPLNIWADKYGCRECDGIPGCTAPGMVDLLKGMCNDLNS